MGKKRKHLGKTSTLKTFETVNEEYGAKRIVEDEPVDYRGLVKRSRIRNQTGFDHLYIVGKINAAEHEAAQIFLHAMSRSGCYIQASDPESLHCTPFSKIGDSIASRVMAFSSAYRRLMSKLDSECVNSLISFLVSTEDPAKSASLFANKIDQIKKALGVLVSFYNIQGINDPRSLVKLYDQA